MVVDKGEIGMTIVRVFQHKYISNYFKTMFKMYGKIIEFIPNNVFQCFQH